MYEGNNYEIYLLYCKDLSHRDDFVARCLKIKNNVKQVMKSLLKLLTPGSGY